MLLNTMELPILRYITFIKFILSIAYSVGSAYDLENDDNERNQACVLLLAYGTLICRVILYPISSLSVYPIKLAFMILVTIVVNINDKYCSNLTGDSFPIYV